MTGGCALLYKQQRAPSRTFYFVEVLPGYLIRTRLAALLLFIIVSLKVEQ